MIYQQRSDASEVVPLIRKIYENLRGSLAMRLAAVFSTDWRGLAEF